MHATQSVPPGIFFSTSSNRVAFSDDMGGLRYRNVTIPSIRESPRTNSADGATYRVAQAALHNFAVGSLYYQRALESGHAARQAKGRKGELPTSSKRRAQVSAPGGEPPLFMQSRRSRLGSVLVFL